MKMNQLRCLEKEFAKNTVFFNAINPDFNMEKVNYPENTWFYINQAYLTVKKEKNIFYCDYFIFGQMINSSNPPENISSYTLKENEVRMIRPKYDRSTGQFKSLYETVGFLVVRRSPEEIFLNMVMIKINQKFFILNIEGKFRVLSQAQYLISIDR